MRSPRTSMRRSPRSWRLEKACVQQRRPNAAKKKKKRLKSSSSSSSHWLLGPSVSREIWQQMRRDWDILSQRSPGSHVSWTPRLWVMVFPFPELARWCVIPHRGEWRCVLFLSTSSCSKDEGRWWEHPALTCFSGQSWSKWCSLELLKKISEVIYPSLQPKGRNLFSKS